MGGVLLKEFHDSLEVSISCEWDCLLLAVLPEDQGGEGLDFNVRNLIGSSVALGNEDVVVLPEFLSNFNVDGSEGFAMTAPGSVELNKDVLMGILDEFVEVLAYDDLYGLIVLFGDFLALHVPL